MTEIPIPRRPRVEYPESEYDFKRSVPSWEVTPPIPGHCRLCSRKIVNRHKRSTTCSKECGDFVMLLRFWDYMSRAVFRRDRACCVCGSELLFDQHEYMLGPFSPECDHIVPVHRGGGQLGPDNLQTLCPRCHRQKSAAEATARKLERDQRRKMEVVCDLSLL